MSNENGTSAAASPSPHDVMSSGSLMTLYTGSTDAVESKPIFIWWEEGPTVGKLGTIYYNDDVQSKNKTKVENQQLPLSKITDVFSGKQHAIFKSSELSSLPSDHCFSLGSKLLPLNLKAETAAERQAWISGIKEVFAKSQASKKGATTTTTTVPSAAASTNAASTAVPAADPIAAMVAGEKFTAVTGMNPSTKQEVFVFFEPTSSKFGVLYQAPVTAEGEQERTKDETTAIALHRVSDVYLGKRAPELSSDVTSGVPSSQCFSIISKDRSLHLIAPNENVRATYIAGIKEVFSQMKIAKSEKAAASTTSTAATATAGSTAPSTTQETDAPPNVLLDGRMYRSLTTKDGVVTATPIFLWHDPADGKLGTLYWSENEGDKTKSPTQSMPVSKIKDVFLGKQTAEFKSEFAKDISSKESFSLMLNKDKGEGLHLVAADEQTRNATLATIKGFWSVPKKKTEPAPAPAPVAAAAVAPVTPTATTPAAAPAVAVTIPASSEKPIGPSDIEMTDMSVPAGNVVPVSTPASPSKEDQARLNAEVSKDPLANIAAMKAGAVFKSYAIVPESSVQSQPEDVFVFLADDDQQVDGPIGSLYYNPGATENRTKSADRQLSLAATRDVFVGKHAWKKANVTQPSFPSTRALSVVTGTRSIHLESPTDLQRAQWATGIRNVFEAAQMKATKASPGTASSGLTRGSEFNQLTVESGELVSRPVFVFYDRTQEKLGTIYWCDAGKREIREGRSIPLHKVSDVFLGKHPEYKETDAAANLRATNCFSLVSKATTVHLEAKNAEQRSATLDEIKFILVNNGKKVDETRSHVTMPEVPMSPRGLTADSVADLTTGQDFEEWRFDATGRHVAGTPVHVWFERNGAGLGTLYWSSTGSRTKTEEQCLPLAEVTDVFVGKHVEEFQHADAAELPQERCISLRSQTHPNHNLNLVAESAQAQRRWVRGLRKAFSESPDTVIDTRAVKSGVIPPEAVSSPKSQRSIRNNLASFAEGHNIVAVTAEGQHHPVMIWFDASEGRAGTVFWSESKEVRVPSQSLPVHTVSDVFVGKKAPALRTESMRDVPANQVFSLASKTKRLDAYAHSEADRKKIIDGIAAAIHAAGTPIREYKHFPSPKSGPAPNQMTANPILRQKLAYIEQGRPVLLHHTVGADAKKIFLWYEPNHGKQGALFWCDAPTSSNQKRVKVPRQTMMLQHISDVLMSRQTDVLKASKSPTLKGENCFSLLTANGPRLDIEVASRADRDEWLKALRMIFSATQKRIVEGAGLPNSRKLQPGTVVDTFFGRGLVAQPTRKDGITPVNVGGTMCYFTGEAIKPAPLVYTPYGVGTFPLNPEVREDGIQRVDLAYATAYLTPDCISTKAPEKALGASATHGSQTREQSEAYLTAGLPLTHIGGQAHTPVFVYFTPAPVPSQAGSIEYNVGSARAAKALGTIPLRTISDLLLGKQTPALQELGASVSDGRVLSIVTKDGRTLDLVAPDVVTRDDLIYALFNLLSTTGRRITQQREGDASSPKSSLSPRADDGARRYSITKTPLPSQSQARTDLSNGQTFKLIIVRPDGSRVTEDAANVFLQPIDNRLVWSSMYWTSRSPSAIDEIRWLELKRVRDVYYNKKTALFLESEYRSIPRERCFSIGTKDKLEWNLIAPSREARDKFFFALQSYMTPVGANPSPSPQPIDTIVSRGALFNRWTGEGDDVQCERIFIFHEQDGTKYGSLYWNSAYGDRTASEMRQMPLHLVKDVFMGKNTRTTRSPPMALVAKDVLFSLVSAPDASDNVEALNLEAPDAMTRSEYVHALKGFFRKTTISHIKTQPLTSAPTGGFGLPAEQLHVKVTGPVMSHEFETALANCSQKSLHIGAIPAVQFLQTGSTFRGNIDAFYVASTGSDVPFGAIYYGPMGSRALVEENSVAIHRIHRITVDERSFTLHTGANELKLESGSSALLAAWLSGLGYLIAAAGFRLTSDAEGTVFSINDSAALARVPAALTLPASVVTSEIRSGTVFNGMFTAFAGAERTTTRVPIRVWLHEDALVWQPLASTTVVPTDEQHIFKLTKMTRISTGKHGPASATLQTADNQLDLESPNQAEMSLFLSGLAALLRQADVSIRSDREAETGTKRAYVLVKSVASRFGGSASSPRAILSPIPSSPVSPDSEASAMREFADHGALFTAYTRKKGQLLHKELIMWIAADEQGVDHLYWGPSDDANARARQPDVDSDNDIEILDIKTIEVGKASETLQSIDDAEVPSARCVAITSSTANLDLVAESAAQAKALVHSIKNLKPLQVVVPQ